MNNRSYSKFAGDGSNPFEEKTDSLRQTTDDIFAPKERLGDDDRVIAKPIDLNLILPDQTQPRRLLPAGLSYRGYSVEDLLDEWWAMANSESGEQIDAIAHVTGEETTRGLDEQEHVPQGHVEKGFMELLELAASIRRDGLINPITVYLADPSHAGERLYIIETGERRWLAYHLLGFLTNDPQWQKIPARQVDIPNVWRQAQENTARSALNAVGLARQLALLLMDLYRNEGDQSFQPYQNFNHDRLFYAQVADGREYPVPYGEGERIVAAMGVKNRVQVNQYRALLRLSDEAWDKGDAENWAEYALRPFVQSATKSESITVVIDSPQADEPETSVPAVSAEPDVPNPAPQNEPPAPPPDDVPLWVITLLRQAYKHVERNPAGWFSSIQSSQNVVALNGIVTIGYLDTKRPNNTDMNTAAYRINDRGCDLIGLSRLEFREPANTTPRQSGSDPSANTLVRPPVRPVFNTQEKRQIDLVKDLTTKITEDPNVLAYWLEEMERVRAIILMRLEQLKKSGGE